MTMPPPEDPDDPQRSRYEAQYFHRALAAALEEVEAGRMPRLIITFPPRHGKSELSSRRFPSWFVGRDPYRHLMVATSNQPFAEDFGRDVRSNINTKAYQQTLQNIRFRKGSKDADRHQTKEGGLITFVGAR